MSAGSDGRRRAPLRGQIWLYDPNPVRGREQGNLRPRIILSDDTFNQTDRGLIVIVPMTRTRRSANLYPYHIEVEPEETGLEFLSSIMCEQLRSISTERLRGRGPRGQISETAMQQIEGRIHLLLNL